MGIANIDWVTISGGCVITAAKINMRTTAYLKFFIKNREEIMRILARRKASTGNSNTEDMPNKTLNAREKYSLIVIMAIKSLPISRKNLHAQGKTTKYPNDPPATKKKVVKNTKGNTSFFSLLYNPGERKSHN